MQVNEITFSHIGPWIIGRKFADNSSDLPQEKICVLVITEACAKGSYKYNKSTTIQVTTSRVTNNSPLSESMSILIYGAICSLCNPRDHCTHSLFQDWCIVKLITSNCPSYLHLGTTLLRGIVVYALVRKAMHGIIVGKRVRTRRITDRYCTHVWMSGMLCCDH